MTAVAGYVPDLMDRSKIAAAAPGAVFVATLDGLARIDADVVLVDLNRPGVLDALPALVARAARVVAFGSHVEHDLLQAARDAGCAEVLRRSEFFSRLGDVLGQADTA